MSNDKLKAELEATRALNGNLIAERDNERAIDAEIRANVEKLKGERDELRGEIDLLKSAKDSTGALANEIMFLREENERLKLLAESYRVKLAKTCEALERLTKVGPPSRPTTGLEYAQVALQDNCKIAEQALEEAREALEKK